VANEWNSAAKIIILSNVPVTGSAARGLPALVSVRLSNRQIFFVIVNNKQYLEHQLMRDGFIAGQLGRTD
jgi:hypothetical protein